MSFFAVLFLLLLAISQIFLSAGDANSMGEGSIILSCCCVALLSLYPFYIQIELSFETLLRQNKDCDDFFLLLSGPFILFLLLLS